MSRSNCVIWTMGHSTLDWVAFLEVLRAHQIACVADVRRFPGSRKFPHFNADGLSQGLTEAGLRYLPIPELGGRRRPSSNAPETVWRNTAFQGYAEHMTSEEYAVGRARLMAEAEEVRTTMLCSESVWWRCHRSLVADDLKASGIRVLHIFNARKLAEHPYTSAARIEGGRLTYRRPG